MKNVVILKKCDLERDFAAAIYLSAPSPPRFLFPVYTTKKVTDFPSSAGMALTTLSLSGSGSLVSASLLGTGKPRTFFTVFELCVLTGGKMPLIRFRGYLGDNDEWIRLFLPR
jgi:hypothetical protein